MKLLIISRQDRSRSFDTLFDGIAKHFDTTVIKLSKEQRNSLTKTISGLGCDNYDRVMFDVPLTRIGKHYKALRNISGLILYEEDAWTEFSEHSKYRNKFIKIYQSTGAFRLITTGYTNSEKFRAAGLDVVVIPKAYDENHLHNLHLGREFGLGFIGRIKTRIYRDRRPFLEKLVMENDLQVLRTDPGEEYLQTLNRIRIFVSADIGFREYMAKNFEAMACGCMLFASRQGGLEEESLGFVDMENVVLYDSVDDAQNKLVMLRDNPDIVERIARKGEDFVREHHTLGSRIIPFVDAIRTDIKEVQPPQRRFMGFRRLVGS